MFSFLLCKCWAYTCDLQTERYFPSFLFSLRLMVDISFVPSCTNKLWKDKKNIRYLSVSWCKIKFWGLFYCSIEELKFDTETFECWLSLISLSNSSVLCSPQYYYYSMITRSYSYCIRYVLLWGSVLSSVDCDSSSSAYSLLNKHETHCSMGERKMIEYWILSTTPISIDFSNFFTFPSGISLLLIHDWLTLCRLLQTDTTPVNVSSLLHPVVNKSISAWVESYIILSFKSFSSSC